MKKPWVVSLLSIVPGLGLIALGRVVAGLAIMAGISLLVFLSLVTTSADLSTWLFIFALILWMLQIGYALLAAIAAAAPQESPEKIARREAQRIQREATAIQRSTKDALTPLRLHTAESLRPAIRELSAILRK